MTSRDSRYQKRLHDSETLEGAYAQPARKFSLEAMTHDIATTRAIKRLAIKHDTDNMMCFVRDKLGMDQY